MNEKLTPKEEAFVQRLFAGDSQRTAYRKAYPNSKAKDEAIDVYACNLLKQNKISLRLKELQEKVSEENIWTKTRVLKELERIVMTAGDYYLRESERGDKPGSQIMSASIAALSEVNKVCGYHAPKEQNINMDINGMSEFKEYVEALKNGI